MHKLEEFRTGFMFFVASVLVPIAYGFKLSAERAFLDGNEITQGVAFLIVTIIFVAGATIARFSASWLLKIKWLRSFLLGRSDVEGFWLLKTVSKEGNSEALNRLGICRMQYMLDCHEFKVETTRFDGEQAYVTQSEVALIRGAGSTVRYLNFFHVDHPLFDGKSGFAYGKFSLGSGNKPVRFQDTIAVQENSFIATQYAERIGSDAISKIKKENPGMDWMKVYLDQQAGSITTESSAEYPDKKALYIKMSKSAEIKASESAAIREESSGS